MKQVKCPDCKHMIDRSSIREHIITCQSYKAKLFENTSKLAEHLSTEYLQFLITQIDMAREVLQERVDQEQQTELEKNGVHKTGSAFTQKIAESQEPLDLEELFAREDKKKVKHNQSSKANKIEENKSSNQKSNTINGDNSEKETLKEKNLKGKDYQQQKTLQIMEQQQMMACTNCKKKIGSDSISQLVFIEPCSHIFCRACVSSYINDQFLEKKGVLKCLQKSCKHTLNSEQIREIIGLQALERMENKLLRDMMNLVVCIKCNQEFEFAEGNSRDAPKTNEAGKKIIKKYAEHFAQNRFICPNVSCKQQQCKQCKSIPYHLGRTCSENQQFKDAKKCRYCNEMLPKGYISTMGIKAFDDICELKECKTIAKNACSKIHKCRHPCMGYIKESACLPCLKEECAKGKVQHGQDQYSYCSICYVQDLKSNPCVMSKCGHIFHYSCLQRRLKIRWLTPRILFSFCQCPLCKQWITLHEQCPLQGDLTKNQHLFIEIKKKALMRLKNQKLDTDNKLTDKGSAYYGKETQYALAIYAYFECYKCKKPYFGGKKSCADAMDSGGADDRRGEQFDPKKLICAQCCPVATKDCESHGKEYISFKCKFCCNISQWFCWGNTHFCDICHKKQLAGDYVSKLAKDKLPKCQGPGKCPSGGKHPENGEQHNLGCLLCRNYKQYHQQQ